MTEEFQDKATAETEVIPSELPILPLRDIVIFPHMLMPLLIARPHSTRLVDDVISNKRLIATILQKNPEIENPQQEHLHEHGCIARIIRMSKFPDQNVRILISGLKRMKVVEIIKSEPFLVGRIEILEDIVKSDLELSALVRTVENQFQEILNLSPGFPEELKLAMPTVEDPSMLADIISANINLPLQERQQLLALPNVKDRLNLLTTFLNRELQVLRLGTEIQSKVNLSFSKTQREYFLREQLKAIQKELGETTDHPSEIKELKEKLEAAEIPSEAKLVAIKELDRLESIPTASAEYTVVQTYLDWLINMPWLKSTKDKLDLEQSAKILDKDHYDLAQVKKRILEYLSVLKLKSDSNSHAAPGKAPVLCFVGPPGVGKTSLGMSIARALGRKFIRISLGGVRDEAEIRGHRRTYVGALPGRILQGIRRAESNNPVFMLDEIDKVGSDYRGDPSAALLEVLDPQQNNNFSDHYLAIPFDLSRVMFIATANILEPIPPALRDRMEVVTLPGYTEEEKLHIAVKYLIPRQIQENGLKKNQLKIHQDALRTIIRNYTREAGVRNLERQLATVCRRTARRIVERKTSKVTLRKPMLSDFLGQPEYIYDVVERTTEPGVAIGLAWTSSGGDILFIEATQMPGCGKLILTGSLGEVMRESAQAALSYVRSHANDFHLPSETFDKTDIHIHVPAGAIPKDGPSAGLTIAISLASLLSKQAVKPRTAMTGEITLRGKILPVGGIKEKVLAAARSGIKTVILPEPNQKDLNDVPEEIQKKLKFQFVKTISDALHCILHKYSGSKRQ